MQSRNPCATRDRTQWGGGLLGFNVSKLVSKEVSKILRNFSLAIKKACHCEDERSEDVAIAKSLSINEITTQSTIARNDQHRHAELVSASQMQEGGAFCRKIAFTLAEVLITLGIIGVVASLTLPPLIQKHQKQVWVNQLKKSVSTWENGFKMMMADDETDDLQNTEFWQKLQELAGGDEFFAYSCNDDVVENYDANDEILKKYFKILSFGDIKNKLSCTLDYKEDVNLDEVVSDEEIYAYKSLGSKEPMGLTLVARKIQLADGTTVGLIGMAFAYKMSYYKNEDIVG